MLSHAAFGRCGASVAAVQGTGISFSTVVVFAVCSESEAGLVGHANAVSEVLPGLDFEGLPASEQSGLLLQEVRARRGGPGLLKNKAAVFCLYRCGLPWLSLPADGAPETSSAREGHAPLFLRGSLHIELGEAEARPFNREPNMKG